MRELPNGSNWHEITVGLVLGDGDEIAEEGGPGEVIVFGWRQSRL
jgi:hypothetical protein